MHVHCSLFKYPIIGTNTLDTFYIVDCNHITSVSMYVAKKTNKDNKKAAAATAVAILYKISRNIQFVVFPAKKIPFSITFISTFL